MPFRLPRLTAIASSIALAASAILLAPIAAQAQETAYHVIDKQHLDGDSKWDYMIVDAAHRHLFLTHGDRVEVFDVDKKQVIATIPNTQGVHGVALAPEFDRGYASDGKDNSVTIFSLSTLQVVGSVATGKKPDAIIYDPASKRVFAANGESGNLTPIDAATGKALPAIALGGQPEFMAVDGKGRLFVNLEDKNQLAAVDTQKQVVTHHYDISASCDEPAGLSIDPVAQHLFVGCHNNKMTIVDGNSGKILDAPAIGRGNDATAYDAGAKLAFASNGDGTLTIVGMGDASHYQVKQTVATMPTARTLAIDPTTHKVYLLATETEPLDPKAQPGQRPRAKAGTFTLITVAP